MTDNGKRLSVVTYHHVRDLPQSRFPHIKGMLTDDFRAQVALLVERYEMATLESALDFLEGGYEPRRDLCLLTFDDGSKDHYTNVLPILAERHIQGLFFVITRCHEEHRVAPVHKNHFLMAGLGVDVYRKTFLEHIAAEYPETPTDVDRARARRTYVWDDPEVAAFKYLVNHRLEMGVRDHVIGKVFANHLGDEAAFARELYLSWHEAREMQKAGMVLGGHSHTHEPLARLPDGAQADDIESCTRLLHKRLAPQALWPFAYPYGGPDTFDARTAELVRDNGYVCAFAGAAGMNAPGQDRFNIARTDCNEATM